MSFVFSAYKLDQFVYKEGVTLREYGVKTYPGVTNETVSPCKLLEMGAFPNCL